MTTLQHLNFAGLPALDLYSRTDHLQQVIESYVKNAVDIPENINFRAALILARMAANPDVPVRPADLRRLGYYHGSNVNYNLTQLVECGYIASRPGVDKRTRWLELTQSGRDLGADVGIQLNFIEEQIGKLFSKEAHKQGVDFLSKTIFGDERPRSSHEIRREQKQTA